MRQGYLAEAKKRHLPVVDASTNEQAVADAIWKIVMGESKKRSKKS
jgi:thymidylate kinase